MTLRSGGELPWAHGFGRALALSAGLTACSAVQSAPKRAPASVVPGSAASPAVFFRYHPQGVAPMLASVELGDGRLLFAGKRGERWLFDPSSKTLEAALPAGEDLLAIARDPEQGSWFVGKSGTSYRARTPLGAFIDVNVPLSPLARVSAAGRALLAVGRDQRLSRSDDDGRTWSPVGPDGTAFVDVAIDAHGRALALASPEALWESDDAGAHFRPSTAPPSGVLSLTAERGGDGIRVTSVLGTSRFGGAEGAGVRQQPSLEDVLKQGAQLPVGPDAGALSAHAAAFGGPGYLEARSLGEGKREWQLIAGPLGGPLGGRPLPEAKGCGQVTLGSFQRHVTFACFTGAGPVSQRVELFSSDDAGATFARTAPDFWAKPQRFRLAVGAGGALLVSGACPSAQEAAGCAPSGILYRRAVPADRAKSAEKKPDAPVEEAGERRPGAAREDAGAEGFEFAVSAVPALAEGVTVELAFDLDGRAAYALSGSTKGTSLTLFVSHDGGRRFEGHDLGEATRDQDPDAGVPLTPGRDGTLALVLGAGRGTPTLVVVDPEGRVLHQGSPPERALLGASGLS
ncbi:MAG TPA: hypothetical protein VGQ57_06395, partial [Polyangiaceae bacterium]|nr:hypothetical protein [Polyangiaceae bacterium]